MNSSDCEVVDLTADDSDAAATSSDGSTSRSLNTASHSNDVAGRVGETQDPPTAPAATIPDALPTMKRARSCDDAGADTVVIVSSSESDDDDGNEEDAGEVVGGRRLRPVDLVLAHIPPSSHDEFSSDSSSAVPATASGAANPPPMDQHRPSSHLPRGSPPSGAASNCSVAAATSFVATLASQRSPFFRGFPQSVKERRERLAQRGLHILRLRPDLVIRDTGSIFDAFVVVHESLCEVDVADCVAEIRSDEKVGMAAHPAIYAHRLQPLPGGPVKETFHDDGEQYAGSKIMSVLRTYRMVGCLIVVTRWYGGKLLGPRRFTHIANAARRVLECHELIPASSSLEAQ